MNETPEVSDAEALAAADRVELMARLCLAGERDCEQRLRAYLATVALTLPAVQIAQLAGYCALMIRGLAGQDAQQILLESIMADRAARGARDAAPKKQFPNN